MGANLEIEASGLTCRRGGRRVFSGISLSVATGGALRLAGPNGSGKSSLLRLLAGLSPPEAGEIRRRGAAIDDDPARHRALLAFMGPVDAVKPSETPRRALAAWADLLGGGEERAALAAAGLAALADTPCRWLSTGQRRRLALARLLLRRVPLWLLDEPANGLDAAGVGLLEAAIAGHRRGGGAVVLALHGTLALPGAEVLALGPGTGA